MIEAKGIYKSYGTLQVLRGVNISVANGEILAIKGPSGAGKSTLLQIIGTLDTPDSGSIYFDGQEVSRMRDKALSTFRNRNIGFVFQAHQLLPEFSALENVMLPALIGGLSKKETVAKATKLLDELGLNHRLKHKPSELSGGERQRVSIARALINSPSVILADEPTGSLDSHNRDEIMSLLSGLRDRYGQTIILVTHDDSLVTIADRILSMSDGVFI